MDVRFWFMIINAFNAKVRKAGRMVFFPAIAVACQAQVLKSLVKGKGGNCIWRTVG